MSNVKPKKSHHGCLTCKRRKVKCDESKPACQRCVNIGTACRYKEPHFKYTSQPERFELKLIHQWSTYTWQTVAFEGRERLYQEEIPALAWQHDHTLYAILLLAAAHLRSTSPHDHMLADAISQYYLKVVSSIQAALSDPGFTPANGDALVASSSLVAIYSLIDKEDEMFSGLKVGWYPLFMGVQKMYGLLDRNISKSIFGGIAGIYIHKEPEYPVPSHMTSLAEACRKNPVYNLPLQHLLAFMEVVDRKVKLEAKSQIMLWPICLSERFVNMINGLDGLALVLLAYYFHTLSCIEGLWYLQSTRYRCSQVCAVVPAQYKQYIAQLDSAGLILDKQ